MKHFPIFSLFFLVLLFSPQLICMEELKPIKSHKSFVSATGNAIAQIGDTIAIKEQILQYPKNQISTYEVNGNFKNEIHPQEQLGQYHLINREGYNQFAIEYGNGIGLYDTEKQEWVHRFDANQYDNPPQHQWGYYDLHFSENNKQLLFTKLGTKKNETYKWDLDSGKQIFHRDWGYKFIARNGIVGYSLLKKNAELFNVETNKLLQSFNIPDQDSFGLPCLTPDGKYLAILISESSDTSKWHYEVYDTELGKKVYVLPGNFPADTSFIFRQQTFENGTYFAGVLNDTIQLYDLAAQGKQLQALEVSQNYFSQGLWISPDQQQVVSVANPSNFVRQERPAYCKFHGDKNKESIDETQCPQEDVGGIVDIWQLKKEFEAVEPESTSGCEIL